MEDVKPACENEAVYVFVNMIMPNWVNKLLNIQWLKWPLVMPYKILNNREMWYRFKHV